MRAIDADALIEFCAERWIPLNIDAVNMQPTIQPEKAQLSQEGTTSDLISRQAVLDAVEKNACNTQRIMDAVNNLPPAQPEPAIPLSWIEKHIEWHKSLDNEFANLAAAHISVMVKKWRDEQNDRTD